LICHAPYKIGYLLDPAATPLIMADPLATLANILQLVDTALKAKERSQDVHYVSQERRKLLSEMDTLRPLLQELRTRLTASSSSGVLQCIDSPLGEFQVTMEQFTDKQNTQHKAENNKDNHNYLVQLHQFKSLLHSWMEDSW
jgi:DNA anti-recombination protein RmuC